MFPLVSLHWFVLGGYPSRYTSKVWRNFQLTYPAVDFFLVLIVEDCLLHPCRIHMFADPKQQIVHWLDTCILDSKRVPTHFLVNCSITFHPRWSVGTVLNVTITPRERVEAFSTSWQKRVDTTINSHTVTKCATLHCDTLQLLYTTTKSVIAVQY